MKRGVYGREWKPKAGGDKVQREEGKELKKDKRR